MGNWTSQAADCEVNFGASAGTLASFLFQTGREAMLQTVGIIIATAMGQAC